MWSRDISMIERHNKPRLTLNAFISAAPRDLVLGKARAFANERKAGKTWSPFHDISIALKDAVVTTSIVGMPTTAGSKAFLNSKAMRNAVIVGSLIETGLIILGKVNLTRIGV
jgi:amidase